MRSFYRNNTTSTHTMTNLEWATALVSWHQQAIVSPLANFPTHPRSGL
jgi:hypothetical protein